jgi:putative transposase
VRFEFIHAEKANFSIKMLCRVLEVSSSGYYRWARATPSQREREDQKLKPAIAAVHAESRGTYGSPRIHAELSDRGFEVGRNRIARLMREMGVSGELPKRFRRTTDSRHGLGFAPDLVKRDFEPSAPNRLWASDITYIWTDEGWAYLAVVIDLFSRRVVGWAFAEHMRAELVLDALERALTTRQASSRLVHHSDRGSQYASEKFRTRLDAAGVAWSMGGTGCCYDNAAVESFFATLKKDLVYRSAWRGLQQARAAISEYINLFYNSRRRHSSIGYISPAAFEAEYQLRRKSRSAA